MWREPGSGSFQSTTASSLAHEPAVPSRNEALLRILFGIRASVALVLRTYLPEYIIVVRSLGAVADFLI